MKTPKLDEIVFTKSPYIVTEDGKRKLIVKFNVM